MTFLGIIGAPRTGKNIIAVLITVLIWRQKMLAKEPFHIFANFHFLDEMEKVVHYIARPQDYIGIKLDSLNSGLALFDEIWAWFESRGSGSAGLRTSFVRQIMNQSGKRGFDLIWISQLGSMADITISRQTYRFFKTFPPTENYFRYGYISSSYYGGKRVMRLKLKKSIASEYYKYYDTREIIEPLTKEDLEQPATEIVLNSMFGNTMESTNEFEDTQTENEIRNIEDNLSKIETIDERIEKTQTQQQNQEETKTAKSLFDFKISDIVPLQRQKNKDEYDSQPKD